MRLAGHPPPLVLTGPAVRQCDVKPGLVLGVLPGIDRPATQVQLDEEWALLMYTDGLIEGWASPEGGDRLGVEGLCDMLARERGSDNDGAAADLPDWLVSRVEERNGGPLADDVAVVLIRPEGAS
jgi:serine phosphatase RsbU (regulator of sigma subunit)